MLESEAFLYSEENLAYLTKILKKIDRDPKPLGFRPYPRCLSVESRMCVS